MKPGVAGEGRLGEPGVAGEGCPVEPGIGVEGRPAEHGVTGEGRPAEPGVAGEGRPVELGVASEGRPVELGVAGEGRPAEPGVADVGLASSGVVQGCEQPVQQVFGEGGAAVVDVGARSQGVQVGVAVGVGQVGETRGVTGDVDTAAADRVGRRGVVTAVLPRRRGVGWRFGCSGGHVLRTSSAVEQLLDQLAAGQMFEDCDALPRDTLT